MSSLDERQLAELADIFQLELRQIAGLRNEAIESELRRRTELLEELKTLLKRFNAQEAGPGPGPGQQQRDAACRCFRPGGGDPQQQQQQQQERHLHVPKQTRSIRGIWHQRVRSSNHFTPVASLGCCGCQASTGLQGPAVATTTVADLLGVVEATSGTVHHKLFKTRTTENNWVPSEAGRWQHQHQQQQHHHHHQQQKHLSVALGSNNKLDNVDLKRTISKLISSFKKNLQQVVEARDAVGKRADVSKLDLLQQKRRGPSDKQLHVQQSAVSIDGSSSSSRRGHRAALLVPDADEWSCRSKGSTTSRAPARTSSQATFPPRQKSCYSYASPAEPHPSPQDWIVPLRHSPKHCYTQTSMPSIFPVQSSCYYQTQQSLDTIVPLYNNKERMISPKPSHNHHNAVKPKFSPNCKPPAVSSEESVFSQPKLQETSWTKELTKLIDECLLNSLSNCEDKQPKQQQEKNVDSPPPPPPATANESIITEKAPRQAAAPPVLVVNKDQIIMTDEALLQPAAAKIHSEAAVQTEVLVTNRPEEPCISTTALVTEPPQESMGSSSSSSNNNNNSSAQFENKVVTVLKDWLKSADFQDLLSESITSKLPAPVAEVPSATRAGASTAAPVSPAAAAAAGGDDHKKWAEVLGLTPEKLTTSRRNVDHPVHNQQQSDPISSNSRPDFTTLTSTRQALLVSAGHQQALLQSADKRATIGTSSREPRGAMPFSAADALNKGPPLTFETLPIDRHLELKARLEAVTKNFKIPSQHILEVANKGMVKLKPRDVFSSEKGLILSSASNQDQQQHSEKLGSESASAGYLDASGGGGAMPCISSSDDEPKFEQVKKDVFGGTVCPSTAAAAAAGTNRREEPASSSSSAAKPGESVINQLLNALKNNKSFDIEDSAQDLSSDSADGFASLPSSREFAVNKSQITRAQVPCGNTAVPTAAVPTAAAAAAVVGSRRRRLNNQLDDDQQQDESESASSFPSWLDRPRNKGVVLDGTCGVILQAGDHGTQRYVVTTEVPKLPGPVFQSQLEQLQHQHHQHRDNNVIIRTASNGDLSGATQDNVDEDATHKDAPKLINTLSSRTHLHNNNNNNNNNSVNDWTEASLNQLGNSLQEDISAEDGTLTRRDYLAPESMLDLMPGSSNGIRDDHQQQQYRRRRRRSREMRSSSSGLRMMMDDESASAGGRQMMKTTMMMMRGTNSNSSTSIVGASDDETVAESVEVLDDSQRLQHHHQQQQQQPTPGDNNNAMTDDDDDDDDDELHQQQQDDKYLSHEIDQWVDDDLVGTADEEQLMQHHSSAQMMSNNQQQHHNQDQPQQLGRRRRGRGQLLEAAAAGDEEEEEEEEAAAVFLARSHSSRMTFPGTEHWTLDDASKGTNLNKEWAQQWGVPINSSDEEDGDINDDDDDQHYAGDDAREASYYGTGQQYVPQARGAAPAEGRCHLSASSVSSSSQLLSTAAAAGLTESAFPYPQTLRQARELARLHQLATASRGQRDADFDPGNEADDETYSAMMNNSCPAPSQQQQQQQQQQLNWVPPADGEARLKYLHSPISTYYHHHHHQSPTTTTTTTNNTTTTTTATTTGTTSATKTNNTTTATDTSSSLRMPEIGILPMSHHRYVPAIMNRAVVMPPLGHSGVASLDDEWENLLSGDSSVSQTFAKRYGIPQLKPFPNNHV